MEDDDRLFFDRLSTFVGLPTGVSLAVVGGLQRIHRCVVPMELGNRQWFEGGDMIHAWEQKRRDGDDALSEIKMFLFRVIRRGFLSLFKATSNHPSFLIKNVLL